MTDSITRASKTMARISRAKKEVELERDGFCFGLILEYGVILMESFVCDFIFRFLTRLSITTSL